MTAEVKEEVETVEEKKEEEVKINPADYSCQVLLEKTTRDKAEDKKFPSDAYIVRYMAGGTECMDLTRSGKQANVIDMYYDKYGKDSVQAIEWGYGNVNPTQYGYKTPEKKRKRKG